MLSTVLVLFCVLNLAQGNELGSGDDFSCNGKIDPPECDELALSDADCARIVLDIVVADICRGHCFCDTTQTTTETSTLSSTASMSATSTFTSTISTTETSTAITTATDTATTTITSTVTSSQSSTQISSVTSSQTSSATTTPAVLLCEGVEDPEDCLGPPYGFVGASRCGTIFLGTNITERCPAMCNIEGCATTATTLSVTRSTKTSSVTSSSSSTSVSETLTVTSTSGTSTSITSATSTSTTESMTTMSSATESKTFTTTIEKCEGEVDNIIQCRFPALCDQSEPYRASCRVQCNSCPTRTTTHTVTTASDTTSTISTGPRTGCENELDDLDCMNLPNPPTAELCQVERIRNACRGLCDACPTSSTVSSVTTSTSMTKSVLDCHGKYDLRECGEEIPLSACDEPSGILRELADANCPAMCGRCPNTTTVTTTSTQRIYECNGIQDEPDCAKVTDAQCDSLVHLQDRCPGRCDACPVTSDTTTPTSTVTTVPTCHGIEDLPVCLVLATRSNCQTDFYKENCRASCNSCESTSTVTKTTTSITITSSSITTTSTVTPACNGKRDPFHCENTPNTYCVGNNKFSSSLRFECPLLCGTCDATLTSTQTSTATSSLTSSATSTVTSSALYTPDLGDLCPDSGLAHFERNQQLLALGGNLFAEDAIQVSTAEECAIECLNVPNLGCAGFSWRRQTGQPGWFCALKSVLPKELRKIVFTENVVGAWYFSRNVWGCSTLTTTVTSTVTSTATSTAIQDSVQLLFLVSCTVSPRRIEDEIETALADQGFNFGPRGVLDVSVARYSTSLTPRRGTPCGGMLTTISFRKSSIGPVAQDYQNNQLAFLQLNLQVPFDEVPVAGLRLSNFESTCLDDPDTLIEAQERFASCLSSKTNAQCYAEICSGNDEQAQKIQRNCPRACRTGCAKMRTCQDDDEMLVVLLAALDNSFSSIVACDRVGEFCDTDYTPLRDVVRKGCPITCDSCLLETTTTSSFTSASSTTSTSSHTTTTKTSVTKSSTTSTTSFSQSSVTQSSLTTSSSTISKTSETVSTQTTSTLSGSSSSSTSSSTGTTTSVSATTTTSSSSVTTTTISTTTSTQSTLTSVTTSSISFPSSSSLTTSTSSSSTTVSLTTTKTTIPVVNVARVADCFQRVDGTAGNLTELPEGFKALDTVDVLEGCMRVCHNMAVCNSILYDIEIKTSGGNCYLHDEQLDASEVPEGMGIMYHQIPNCAVLPSTSTTTFSTTTFSTTTFSTSLTSSTQIKVEETGDEDDINNIIIPVVAGSVLFCCLCLCAVLLLCKHRRKKRENYEVEHRINNSNWQRTPPDVSLVHMTAINDKKSDLSLINDREESPVMLGHRGSEGMNMYFHASGKEVADDEIVEAPNDNRMSTFSGIASPPPQSPSTESESSPRPELVMVNFDSPDGSIGEASSIHGDSQPTTPMGFPKEMSSDEQEGMRYLGISEPPSRTPPKLALDGGPPLSAPPARAPPSAPPSAVAATSEETPVFLVGQPPDRKAPTVASPKRATSPKERRSSSVGIDQSGDVREEDVTESFV